jgi:hypothetical protein
MALRATEGDESGLAAVGQTLEGLAKMAAEGRESGSRSSRVGTI